MITLKLFGFLLLALFVAVVLLRIAFPPQPELTENTWRELFSRVS